MSTTITAAPPSAELLSAAAAFDGAATNLGAGVELMFARWQRLRIAGATHNPDPLQGVTFADATEAVLDQRANPSRGAFSILSVIHRA